MNGIKLAKGLTMPANVASQTVSVLGIRGAGKTNTAGVIAEELLDLNQQIAIIDPTDAWWGLRSGYPVFIFGGSHGDIPLTDEDGRAIAEFIVTERVPVILSLRHLRKAAQRRFVADFCEELYHLKGEDRYRSPLTVFFDEAPLFVPQRVMAETARVVGAVEDLIARGRNSGFGVILISQRSATLNKDVLTQSDTLIVHRLPSPQDRKALADWIEENATIEEYKTVLASLAKLANGEAWIWAPPLDVFQRTQIRIRRTFDSSASPKVGQKIAPPKKLADIDLGALKGKLADAVARRKADDPAALKRRIAELEASGGASKADLAAEFQRGAGQAFTLIEGPIADLLLVLEPFPAMLKAVERFNANFVKWKETPTPHVTAKHSAIRPGPVAQVAHVVYRGHPDQLKPFKAVAIPPGERKMLTAIAQHVSGVVREQLTILTGYKRSTRDAYISRLKERGFIEVEQHGGRIKMLQAGLSALPEDFEPLPTGGKLRDYWASKLPPGESRIFQIVIGSYPNSVERSAIDKETGLARSSRDAYLSRLMSRKLIERDGPGSVKANRNLYLNGE